MHTLDTMGLAENRDPRWRRCRMLTSAVCPQPASISARSDSYSAKVLFQWPRTPLLCLVRRSWWGLWWISVRSSAWSLGDCPSAALHGNTKWQLLKSWVTVPAWVLRCIITSRYSCMCVWSHFCHVQLFVTLWTVALQVPLFMGFSKQEYWSGLSFPSPGDLPHPRI